MSLLIKSAGILLACGITTFSTVVAGEPENNIIADISENIESQLYSMPPEIQEHYALRMYRITGDEKYYFPILYNVRIESLQLIADCDSILDNDYAKSRTETLLEKFSGDDRKSRYRRKLFEDAGSMLFYLDCLHTCAKLSDYNLPDSQVTRAIETALDALKTVDFKSFLLDHDVIRYFAAQAVNYIYDLYYLGIADIRVDYSRAFIEVFPDRDDDMMGKLEYKDKIYGLTHFIFAASKYYQQKVDSLEFKWIIGYFDKNTDRIISETKEDIIAEVGLCYILTGQTDHAALARAKNTISASFDREAGVIPSPSGKTDLEIGEHRNVIAIMLLSDGFELHPGPDFEKAPDYFNKVFTSD